MYFWKKQHIGKQIVNWLGDWKQAAIFRACGFDRGHYEKATLSNQQAIPGCCLAERDRG